MPTEELKLKITTDTSDTKSSAASMQASFVRATRAIETALKRLEKQEEKGHRKRSGQWKKWGRTATRAISRVRMALTSQLFHSLTRVAQSVVKLSSEFETGMAGIATVLDKDVLPRLGEVRKELIRLSTEGDQSLNTLSSALRLALSSGISDLNKAIALTKQADVIATAALTTTGTSMKALISVVNAYGVTAGDTGAISDQFFMTQKLGATNVELLAKNLGKILPIAKATGLRLSEINAALAALTRSGLSTAMATTALRSMLSSILRPGKIATDLYKKLGISYGDAAVKAKGFAGVLSEIRKKVGTNTTALSKLFPNVRALTAATALVGAQNQTFVDSLKKIENSAGSTQEAYEKMQDTFKFTSDQFKNILNSVWIDLSKEAFGVLKDSLAGLNAWLLTNKKSFAKWGKGIGESVKEASVQIVSFGKVAVTAMGMVGGALAKSLRGLALLFSFGMSEKLVARTRKNMEGWKENARLGIQMQRALAKEGAYVANAYRKALPAWLDYLKENDRLLYLQDKGIKLSDGQLARLRMIQDARRRGEAALQKDIALKKQQADAVRRLAKEEAERRKKIGTAATKRQASKDNQIMRAAIVQAKLRSAAYRKAERDRLSAQRKALRDAIALRKKQFDNETKFNKARFQAKEAQFQGEQRIARLRQQLQKARGPVGEGAQLQQGATARIAAVTQQIKKLNFQIAETQRLQASAMGLTAAGRQQISDLTKQIALRQQEISLIRKTATAQIEGLSLMGRMRRADEQDVLAYTQRQAEMFRSLRNEAIMGVGGAISSVMEGIVSGQQNILQSAGKMFLDMLGGMAMKLGAFYVAAGIPAMFVPPYTGAGAVAGGVALMALGGALKGAGSLIGGAGSSSGGGSSSSASAGRPPDIGSPESSRGLAGQRTGREAGPIQFIFASGLAPWDRRSRQGHFSDMRRYFREEGRAAGVADPFEVAQRMKAKKVG